MKASAAIAVGLGAMMVLALVAGDAAARPFPEIERGHELSCSGARARLAVAVRWRKANRRGAHRGYAVGLVRTGSGRVLGRRVSSKRLRKRRSQSVRYRFRLPKRASRRLCKGGAKAEVVASHGHDKNRKGLVEIYRVGRKTLGGGARARRAVVAADQTGADCRFGITIKAGAQLQGCDLVGVQLSGAELSGADLSNADLSAANLLSADLSYADLSYADLSHANLTGAVLDGASLFGANLSGAFLDGATCTGTILPDGSLTDVGAIFCPSTLASGD